MHRHRNRVGSTLRPGGKNAFFGMGAPLVLPATAFTSSPNTPTVSNPVESALAKAVENSRIGVIEKKSPWPTILLAGIAGALLTYYITTKMSK